MRQGELRVPFSMNSMRRNRFSFVLPSAVLVLLLWLPFGFSLHGLIEEWGVLGLFTNTGPVLFVKSHSVLDAHRLRPLTVFPHAIGYLLDRDSFDAWHWIMIATLVVKGAASSYLAAIATRSPRWGVFFGLLVLLYPADTMQLSFRSQHINMSLALLLLGAGFLVRAQFRQVGWTRWVTVAAGAVSMLAAQMMYEVALMMVALPLFVLWCRDGAGPTLRDLRKNPAPTLGWIAPALVYVLYVMYASASGGDSYQQAITDRNSPFKVLYHALPKLFDVGVVRALVGGWFDAWGMARGEFQNYIYLLAFGLICSACVALFPRNEDAAPASSLIATERFREARMRLRVAVSGALLLMLGYAPYLFSGSHVLISQRTYIFATIGAALVVLALVMSLARLSRALACASVLLLITTGAAAQLYQFHHYVNLSEAQRKVLRAIVENFDGNTEGGKTLVILDYSNQLNHTWFLRDNLDAALTYLYDRPVSMPDICLMPDGDWQRLDSLGRSGRCVEDSENWTFKAAEQLPNAATPAKDLVRPKSQVVKIVIDQDGNVVPDEGLDAYRQQLASADTPAARRYRNILIPKSPIVDLDLFEHADGGSSHRLDFGKWWSLEQPVRGSGWREAEWSAGHLHHDAAAWKMHEKSRLLFNIEPVDQPYRLTGHFDVVLNDSIQQSIRVLVNGIEVSLLWSPNYKFSATIPKGILRRGTNTIEIHSAVDKTNYGLSARLDELEVQPQK